MAVYQTAATWGTKTVTGLGSNTTYTFKVKAQNGAAVDTAFSSTTSGLTSPGAPTVTTQAATAPTTSSATLNGTVTGDGGGTLTDRGFYWKTSPTVTTSDSILPEGGTSVAAYSKDLTSLLVNTIYYYRAYATNAAGTTIGGSDSIFYTLANTPNAPTVNNPQRGTLDVTIDTGDGNPAATTYAIQDTASSNYVQTNGSLGVSAVYKTAVNWATKTVTGLSSATLYTFQVKAQNGAAIDTAFGATATGTTLFSPPVIAAWDVNGLAGGTGNYGASPLTATQADSNTTVGGLTRGAGVTVSGTASANAWGGNGWNVATEALAISGNRYATFTVTANSGKSVSLDSISKFYYKTSGTGASNGALQYSLDGSTFTDITSSIAYSLGASSSISPIDLSGVSALQNVPFTKTISFRIVNWGASSSAGTWYVNDGNASGNDLEVIGTVNDVYTVTYDENNATSGSVPVDASSPYLAAATVTVAANTGTLARTGFTFNGWNTAADGTGDAYTATGSETFAMGTANVTLYAQWTAAATHTLTYTAGTHGSITGTSPQTVADGADGSAVTAVPDSGYHFVDWTPGGSTSNPRTDTAVTIDISVTANFAATDVTFGSGAANLAAGSYHNIVIQSGAVITLTGDVVIVGTITVESGGTFDMGAFVISGGGAFDLQAGGSLGIGNAGGVSASGATGNVQLTGTRHYDTAAFYRFYGDINGIVGDGLPMTVAGLTIANTGPDGNNTVVGNSGQIVTGLLLILDGVYESHSDYNNVHVAAGGTLSLSAAITVSGDWTIDPGTFDVNNDPVLPAGVFAPNGFTVTFDGVGDQQLTAGGGVNGSNGLNFAGVTINKDGGTAYLGDNTDLTNLTVTKGILASNGSWGIAADSVTIATNGTLTLDGDNMSVAGNWSNGGTFNAGTSSVSIYQLGAHPDVNPVSVSGSSTFYNFSVFSNSGPRTVTFEAGTTQTVTNEIAFLGAVGRILSLRSSVDGTQWNVKAPASQFVNYADAKDSNASTGTTIAQTNSIDSGNNVNWNFGPVTPLTISYSTNPATYTIGTAIATNSASYTGGAPTSYSVAPTLPAGLNFNTSTGAITGTPTAITPTATYVVTGTNGAGSAQVNLSITVNDVAPSGLSYSNSNATYTVGTTIPDNVPSYSGGTATSWVIDPALPAGLSFNTSTGVISGTPTAAAPLATYSVFATNSGGTTNFAFGITVQKGTPTLTFTTSPTPTFPGSDFSVSASATNPIYDGTVSYSYVSGPCSFVSGATFHQTSAGSCVVQASGTSTANWNAPASVQQTVTITLQQYQLTINANPGAGGTTTPSGTSTVDHGAATAIQASANSGYTFSNWSSSDAGVTFGDANLATTTVTLASGNATITANFAATSQTLTFESNGGSAVTAITQDFGTPISAPADPTKAGYTFAGWYDEAGLTTLHTFSTMGLSTTVYAKWTAASQTLTFDSNGGSAVTAITQDFGTPISAPADPTKAGYTFAGWYDEAGLTTLHTFSTMGLSTTVYAKWTANATHTVTYALGGGTGTAPTQADVSEGASFTVATGAGLTKAGYTFNGWNDGTNPYAASSTYTMGTVDVTLTAQWTIIGCTAPSTVYVDASWSAVVADADPDGAGPATRFGCDSFATVAGGIAGVADNGSVAVADGTYVESGQIVVNKNVTVTGTTRAGTVIKPAGDTGNTGDSKGWFLVDAAKTFNLSNVTLDGNGMKTRQAIRYNGGGTVNNVAFLNIKYEENGPAYQGCGVRIGDGNVDVTNSTFTGMGRVGVLAEGTATGTISGNTYTGKGAGDWLDYAFDIEFGANYTITGNTITGNRGVATSDGSDSAAISVWGDPGTTATISGNSITNNKTGVALAMVGEVASPTVTITSNTITGNENGLGTQDAFGVSSPNLTITGSTITGNSVAGIWIAPGTGTANMNIHHNRIVGNGDGVFMGASALASSISSGEGKRVRKENAANLTNETVTVENNWWGCNAGPGGGGCDSAVGLTDFSPWIVLSTSATPATINPSGSSTVSADMTHNSATAVPTGTLPNIAVAWSATNGTMAPPSGTVTAGAAASDFTSTSASNGAGCATVDSELVCSAINVNHVNVTYSGNTNTGGNPPIDAIDYASGGTVTVLGNTGSLVKAGYTFADWNTAADGLGTAYAPAATFSISANTTLYAQWAIDNHTVIFDSNGGSGSMANQTNNLPTALTANTFTRTGYTFAGWGTAAGGPVVYTDTASYPFTANATLYAQWTVDNRDTPFTMLVDRDRVLSIPIAHAEGNYTCDDATFNSLEENGQIVFRYCDENGEATDAANPNGARSNIAGICNIGRNVLGMMPHPERACEEMLGSNDGRDIFRSLSGAIEAAS